MHNKLIANKLGALGAILQASTTSATADYSPSAAAALLTLRDRQPMTVTALAGTVGLSQPATTRLLDRLVVQGYVIRKTGANAKEVALRLTNKGQREASRLQRRRLDRLLAMVEKLSPTKQKQLAAILDEILAAQTESRAQARYYCRFCDHKLCDGADCPVGSAANAIDAA